MLCVFLILFNSILIGIVGTTTWIMGSEPVRINFGRVVGSYNDTIFLLGGQMALYGIQKFQTTTKRFTYRDDNALPLYTKAFGQGWTQKEHIIYFTQTESKLAMYRMDTEQYISNWMDVPIDIGVDACLASSNDHLFVVGGSYSSTSSPTFHNKLQIFSLSTLQWTNNASSMNTARTTAACIVANDYLWVFGGLESWPYALSNIISTNERIGLINITHNAWTASVWVFVEPLTKNLEGLRAVVHKDIIYIIGGATGANSSDIVHLMDTKTGAITGTDTLPFKTVYSSPILVDDILYVFAGRGFGTTISNKWAYSHLPTLNPSTAPSASTTDPSASLNITLVHSTIFSAPERDSDISNTHIILIALGAFVFCIALCMVVVYKKHESSNDIEIDAAQGKEAEVAPIEKMIVMDVDKDSEPDDVEKDAVKRWLTDNVKLPKYYNLLLENGYDKLDFIRDIEDKTDLQEIGITLPGHQVRILMEINRLNEKHVTRIFKVEESMTESTQEDPKDTLTAQK
eukprot:356677_1